MSNEKTRFRVAARRDSYLDIVPARPPIPAGNGSSGLNFPSLDRTAAYGPAASGSMVPMENLLATYLTNGLAARIVDLVVDDAFSRGFLFKGDTNDNFVCNEFSRLQVQKRLTTGQRWAELFGASAVVIYSDDAADTTIPIDPNNPGKLHRLRAVDLTSITPYGPAMEADPRSPMFGLYAFYQIQSQHGAAAQIVHHTRIIRLSGADLPDMFVRGAVVPWMGKSILSGVYDEVQRYENMSRWTERMFERKQQLIYLMEGLGEYLTEMAEGDDIGAGKRLVQERINMIDTVRSVLNTIVIDNGLVNTEGQTVSKGDAIEAQDLNLSNVPQTLATMQMNIASKSGYSVTVLFGRSASGLNSSGDRELESHYNRCAEIRERANAGIQYLTQLVLNQPDAKRRFNKKKKLTPEVTFGPLWLPSDLEVAQANQANATANFNNANAIGVLLSNALSPEAALNWMVEQGMFGLTQEMVPTVLAYVTQKQAELKKQNAAKTTVPPQNKNTVKP